MNDALNTYLEKHTSPPTEHLQELYRQTGIQTLYPRMISGHVQGKFLEMISFMIQPKRVLEIGTFTGYSAISLAAGLPEEGKLFTIEHNEEMEPIINEFVEKSGFKNKIELLLGDAKKIIPTLDGQFDLIFLDADKDAYPMYYPLLIEKLRIGGFLLVDNVLWSMKVLDKEGVDNETKAIQQFNLLVANDPQVEQVMLSVRDGLLLIRKL